MGKDNGKRKLKHPKKIRTRSDAEIRETVVAYKNLFKVDPFLTNMMLLCSELSEYIPIPMNDEERMTTFIKENQDGLVFQFVRRFKSVDEYAIPESLYPAGKCNERLLF